MRDDAGSQALGVVRPVKRRFRSRILRQESLAEASDACVRREILVVCRSLRVTQSFGGSFPAAAAAHEVLRGDAGLVS